MNANELFSNIRATLGRKLSPRVVRNRYDVFHVDGIRDDDGKPVGYELTAPATLYKNVGFQNSTHQVDFSLQMPAQQFMVDGVAHWPFESLNLKLEVEPAYHDIATEFARKAFGERVLGHVHYGIMPGVINYEDGNPVFKIDPEHMNGILFYADQPLKAFASFRRYNCVDLGAVQILLLPSAIAAELIA
ncbi:hypothetical protein IJ117_01960 [Candidatus Saccharibacteria bacterium]|nr:hypothetical protein [Candidatus Saccharibacteria bacterium]